MLVDRDPAAVVDDGEPPGRPFHGLEYHLDAGGKAGHRLVHRIVEHLCGEMVEGALVDSADIHSRPAPDGLQPLQHLDRMGVIFGGRRGGGREQV